MNTRKVGINVVSVKLKHPSIGGGGSWRMGDISKLSTRGNMIEKWILVYNLFLLLFFRLRTSKEVSVTSHLGYRTEQRALLHPSQRHWSRQSSLLHPTLEWSSPSTWWQTFRKSRARNWRRPWERCDSRISITREFHKQKQNEINGMMTMLVDHKRITFFFFSLKQIYFLIRKGEKVYKEKKIWQSKICWNNQEYASKWTCSQEYRTLLNTSRPCRESALSRLMNPLLVPASTSV